MNSVFCKYCGQKLNKDFVFCPLCGEKVRSVLSGDSYSNNDDIYSLESLEVPSSLQSLKQSSVKDTQCNSCLSEPDISDFPENLAQKELSSILDDISESDTRGEYPSRSLSLLDEYIVKYPENASKAYYYKGVILGHELNPTPNITEVYLCLNKAFSLGEINAAYDLMNHIRAYDGKITVPHEPWEYYARILIYEVGKGDPSAVSLLSAALLSGEVTEKYENEAHKLIAIGSAEGKDVLITMMKDILFDVSDEVFNLMIEQHSIMLANSDDKLLLILMESLYEYACLYIFSSSGTEYSNLRILKIADLLSKYDSTPTYNLQGLIRERGIMVKQDSEEAKKYYEKAAELGDMEGFFRLGYLHLSKEGKIHDPVKAAYYFRKIAIIHPAARSNLILLLKAKSVSREYENELSDLWIAALEEETLDEGANFHLTTLYNEGAEGLPKDKMKAMEILENIDEECYPARTYLAFMYLQFSSKTEEAIKILERVVEANDPGGLYIYGDLLLKGKNGVQCNENRAVELLEKAYELGVKDAAVSLSNYYANKCQDSSYYPQAVSWYIRAIEAVAHVRFARYFGDSILEIQYDENIDYHTDEVTTEELSFSVQNDTGNNNEQLDAERTEKSTQEKQITNTDFSHNDSEQLLWWQEYINLRDAGDKAEALVYATLKQKSYPDSFWANFMLAASKIDFNEPANATKYFDIALEISFREGDEREAYRMIARLLLTNNHLSYASNYADQGLQKFPDDIVLFEIYFGILRENSNTGYVRQMLNQKGQLVHDSHRKLILAFTYYDDLFSMFEEFNIDGEVYQTILGMNKLKQVSSIIDKLKQTIPTEVHIEANNIDCEYAEILKKESQVDINELHKAVKDMEERINFETEKKFIFAYAKIPLIALLVSIFLFGVSAFLAVVLLAFGILGIIAARVPNWRLFLYNRPGSTLPPYNTFFAIRDLFRDLIDDSH